MKLTSKKYYLDYNATSPLADAVYQWFTEGDFLSACANPSSFHSSGKAARKYINETTESLYKIFGLSKDFMLLYHSGATEGVNTAIKGFANWNAKKGRVPAHFFLSTVDHNVAPSCGDELEEQGHIQHRFSVDKCGDFDKEDLIKQIKACEGPVILNYLWSNNETGVVWPLEMAAEIKKATGCFVHVDGVQAPGKVKNFQKLDPTLDFYTFSGHKFGALKGQGFSFIKQNFPFSGLIQGGTQQGGMRSGTENPVSVYSLKLALEELLEKFDYDSCKQAKLKFENWLRETLADKGEIIGEQAKQRNCQTCSFVIYGQKSDLIMAALDQEGVEVSSGSACSSGLPRPNRILLALGHDKVNAKGGIRISFSPFLKEQDIDEVVAKVGPVLQKFL